jgi:hypothetical protein
MPVPVPQPAPTANPETFTEYGYLIEYANGNRCAVGLLAATASDEEGWQLMGYYAKGEPSAQMRGDRHVLVSRQVTRTAWADVAAPAAVDPFDGHYVHCYVRDGAHCSCGYDAKVRRLAADGPAAADCHPTTAEES